MTSRLGRCVLRCTFVAALVGAKEVTAQVSIGPVTDAVRVGVDLEADSARAQALALLLAPLAPPGAVTEWDDGSVGLAVGETMLANIVNWLYMEYLRNWKDLTRASPTTWTTNVVHGPSWDDNKFDINWWSHPFGGSNYFSAGRSNGLDYEHSFLLTLLGSALWECCGESHRASLSDLVTTTLGGVSLGEVVYRVGSQFYQQGAWPLRTLAGVAAPPRALTRWVLGRPKTAPSEEHWDLPSSWNLSFNGGVSTSFVSFDFDVKDPVALKEPGTFVELTYAYGDPATLTKGVSKPYDHFVATVELNQWGRRSFVTRVQIRGNLWPLVERDNGWDDLITLYQGFDYLNIGPPQLADERNKRLVEFGMQSLGVATAFHNNVIWEGAQLSVGFEGHAGFGGVNSEYADKGMIADSVRQERYREYDFTLGSGGGASVDLNFWNAVRLNSYGRFDHLGVIDGSNVGGYGSAHNVLQLGGAVVAPRLLNFVFHSLIPSMTNDVGVGIDFKYHKRDSWFDNPDYEPITRSNYRQLRFYLAYDTDVRPGRIFPF